MAIPTEITTAVKSPATTANTFCTPAAAASPMASPFSVTRDAIASARSIGAGGLRPSDVASGSTSSRTRAAISGRRSTNVIAAFRRAAPAPSRTAKVTTTVAR